MDMVASTDDEGESAVEPPAEQEMSSTTAVDRRLDAREIDGNPFAEITRTLEELSQGETLLLVNSFEPEPLYEVLDRRGFTYDTAQVGEAVWHVTIRHA